MRRLLIEALTYPGILVRQLIEAGNYPHASFYAATGERCHNCDGTSDCGWDKCLEDFVHRDDKTTDELGESLREGIKLVETLHSKLMHDETTCTCETCIWIRNAEHLTEEIEHHLPHVEPDLHHYVHEESPPK
jgi:hypothetical protein